MIDIALKFLADELNAYLLAETASDLVKIEVSKLVDESGKYAFGTNKIAASIINIEEDCIFKSQTPDHKLVNGQHLVMEPELKVNLYIIFAANFTVYDQALKYISFILTYFQSHRFFTPDRHPTLDPRIEKLVPELQSLNYEQINQIWAFVGGKQLPAIIYKVRMVALQSKIPTAINRPIEEINTIIHSK
jgi:hypothetical protein